MRDDREIREMPENLVYGRNPVREALRGETGVDRVLVLRDAHKGPLGELIAQAKEKGVPVQPVDKARLDQLCGDMHQGICAYLAQRAYATVEQMLAVAQERGEDPFLVVLDGIEDPHNLGSILRSAECAGAHGVIIQKRRAVGLTPTVAKASSGAIEYMPVARVTNIARTVEELKEKGLWVTGAAMAGQDYTTVDFKGPVCLVIGGEGGGLSRLVEEKCDFLAAIPMRGKISSLNASVAAAIMMYEVLRHRGAPR